MRAPDIDHRAELDVTTHNRLVGGEGDPSTDSGFPDPLHVRGIRAEDLVVNSDVQSRFAQAPRKLYLPQRAVDEEDVLMRPGRTAGGWPR